MRTSPLLSEGTFGAEAGYPDGEADADVSSGHSRCRVEGSTSKMQSPLEGELPRGDKGWWRVGGGARSRKRRRTVCRALPSKFRLRHRGGGRAETWSALYPMPHTRS